jgi:hypothetical protein
VVERYDGIETPDLSVGKSCDHFCGGGCRWRLRKLDAQDIRRQFVAYTDNMRREY